MAGGDEVVCGGREAEIGEKYVSGIESSPQVPDSGLDSIVDVTDSISQSLEVEALEHNFLIKIPRYQDDNIKHQIRSTRAILDDKTQIRDAICADLLQKRANMSAYIQEYNAARREEKEARCLVTSKRHEIQGVEAMINRYKNAMTIQQADYRIAHVEHIIHHQARPLQDQEQFLRNLNQFKFLRRELASGMGTDEEVRYAIDTYDQNVERLESLKRELDSLKDNVSMAEALAISTGRKHEEEDMKELELVAQLEAADGVRQHAYAHLNGLKKQSYDKNKNFRQYKEDLLTARYLASRGDKDVLSQLCANQVEAFIEKWNNDDEFRKDYVSRGNANASRSQNASQASEVPRYVLILPFSNEIEADLAEYILTKEENDEARTAEELRKEEIAAKLKEQQRLEEKAKAIEALERKKRNAEKAQLRSELRARKEAEQKEKEREKQLRKKEKKVEDDRDGRTNGQDAANSEILNGAASEKKTLKPTAGHFFSKQLKSKPLPAPVLNKNKKRLQQLEKVLPGVLVVVFVFMVINSSYFLEFKYHP